MRLDDWYLPEGERDGAVVLAAGSVLGKEAAPGLPVRSDRCQSLVTVVADVCPPTPDPLYDLTTLIDDSGVLSVTCDLQDIDVFRTAEQGSVAEVLIQEICVVGVRQVSGGVSGSAARHAGGPGGTLVARQASPTPVQHRASR